MPGNPAISSGLFGPRRPDIVRRVSIVLHSEDGIRRMTAIHSPISAFSGSASGTAVLVFCAVALASCSVGSEISLSRGLVSNGRSTTAARPSGCRPWRCRGSNAYGYSGIAPVASLVSVNGKFFGTTEDGGTNGLQGRFRNRLQHVRSFASLLRKSELGGFIERCHLYDQ